MNVHAPTEDKTDDMKDSFCEELEHVLYQFLKYHFKFFLGDFSRKACTDDIFKPTTGNTSLHEISDDGARVVNFAISKNLSRVQCSKLAPSINSLRYLLVERHTQ
jgi:hypothetical protein